MHSLDQLYAFVSVYEHHSYSAAGRELNKDRTTVRELVKSYEDILGLELFTIIGRKANPTERATQLYPQAKLVLRQNRKLLEFGNAMFQEPKTRLKLGYDIDFPVDFIAELERRCLSFFPQVRVQWIETHRDNALKQVSERELDLAILPAIGGISPRYPLIFKHLGYISYGLYVGAKSPLAQRAAFTIEDAQLEVQYLSFNNMNSDGMIQAFSSHTRAVSSHTLLVKMLKNEGWALLPVPLGEYYAKKQLLKKLPTPLLANDVKMPFSLFHPIGDEQQATTKALVAWCSELAKSYFS
ncbi:LysR family transcriptional regulator [Vibrio alfacsensis]|uniref:LysR family transcriptional regulator n=1 Tax=Vibrio alfacsensis TaxID=1074311 RepID=UPI001BF0B263|nr:LysR family transcriptional regulator [Vibrio alfacsensis]BCN25574.1 LysR family transcriptional regulator [Vibrio alfacsensis]